MTLGEKLRYLREERRTTLGEASRGTRIQVRYLELLESGGYDFLPADVYVRGFLRSYADFLGVDEETLIRLYEKEKGIRENVAKSRGPKKGNRYVKPVNISSFVFTPRKLLVAFSFLLLIGSFAYLYRELGSFSDEPRLVIFNPKDNSDTKDGSVVVEGRTDKDSKLFINEQSVLVDDEGGFREELNIQSGVNTIAFHVVNKFGKERTESVSVRGDFQDESQSSSVGDSEQSSGSEVSRESDGTMHLEIRVDPGPVWMNVEADGKLVFSGTMLAGAAQLFDAKEKFVISSGRGNATFLKFNGQDVGTLGQDPGAVKDRVIDKDTEFSQ